MMFLMAHCTNSPGPCVITNTTLIAVLVRVEVVIYLFYLCLMGVHGRLVGVVSQEHCLGGPGWLKHVIKDCSSPPVR